MLSDVLAPMRDDKNLPLKLIMIIGIPIFTFLLLVMFIDLGKIKNLVEEISVGILLIIIFISFLRPFLGGLRSSFTYQPMGNLSVKDATKGYILSAFGTIFLPSAIGGDIFRIEHMKNCTGGSRKEAFLVAGLERVVGFLCLFILVFLISFSDLPYSISTNLLIFIIMSSILLVSLIILIIMKFGKGEILILANEYIKIYSTRKLLLGVFALSLLFQIVSLSVPIIVGYSLGGLEVAANIALMTPFIALFSTLPISIGGLGLREASYVGLGALVGIENEVAFLAGLSLSVSIIISGLPGILFQNELIMNQGNDE
ncbi:MAG: hypothetical protein CMB64_01255 [Euryarchaeota archaeon]|nr:hypothetical protein [Euryarchaeota archaeon]